MSFKVKAFFLLWPLLVVVNSFATEHPKTDFIHQKHLNKEIVNKWSKYYLTRGKETLIAQMRQGRKYKSLIFKILQKHNLPVELYYLGLIESGYKQKALSVAGARGPWQFMPATARRYGLKVSKKLDERLNVVKSTHAAARYLKDLHNVFHDWGLAMAAYNSGEYRVLEAIRKSKSRSIREIIEKENLPRETQNYVSKIWVVMLMEILGPKYGFATGKTKMWNDVKLVKISQKLDMKSFCQKLGLSMNDFLALNGDLSEKVLNHDDTYPLTVAIPSNKASLVTPKFLSSL